MSRSPVSNLGELWRKDGSVTIVGMQRPRSPKTTERRFNFAGGKNEDWNTVSSAVTALFQRKKLASRELNHLTEKVKNVKKEIGNQGICDLFRESILMKGMIILREDVKAKNGEVLLDKLADSWTYFYSYILPLLQAIFLNVQPPDGQSIRDISLVSFRDIVVLKTKLEEAFIMDLTVPPRLVQMLLVLQSVHDSKLPENRNYKKLEHLISYVVSPFLSSSGLRTKPVKQSREPKPTESVDDVPPPIDEPRERQTDRKPRPASVGSLELQSRYSAERLHETALRSEQSRRYTFATGSFTDSSDNSVFGFDSGIGTVKIVSTTSAV